MDKIEPHLSIIETLLAKGEQWSEISKKTDTDPDELKNRIFRYLDKLEAYEIRHLMALCGWKTTDRCANEHNKHVSFSIWFSRWDWHGLRTGDKITFHGHTTDTDQITKTIRNTAKITINAWINFPETIPVQTYNGIKKHKGISVFKYNDQSKSWIQ
jgi:hypothetical protein